MPRSTSIRKYKSHRERGKYRKFSSHRDERSRSRSHRRHTEKHRKHYKTYDRHYRRDGHRDRDGHRYRHKYDKYSSPERSRDRSPRDYSYHRKDSKRHHKHDRHDRKPHHQYRHSSEYSETKSYSNQKNPIKQSSDDEKDRTKDAGHYKYREGYILKDQYRILKHLGDGTFGRVLEVEDIKTKQLYAVKVIRAVQRYVESAQTEVEILQDIKSKDPEGVNQIVKLETAFLKDPSRPNKEQNYFMVFEKLGMSLYDFIKMNNYRGFTIEYLQSFARQILTSIGFMHSIGLTHTDLKPENILLVNDEYEPIKYKINLEFDDRSSTCSKSEEKIYYKPRYDKIKIIDMGGATYENEYHSSIINTRQYRAPEVMLACCPWNHSSDVWSIGCILLELFTGDLFFQTHDTYEHLAMIDKATGPIPYWMGNRADSKLKKHFILEEEYHHKHGTFFDWPKYSSGNKSTKRVANMKLIDDIIPPNYPEFKDLIKRMLTIDPEKRIKCSEALDHDFFKVKYEEKL